MLNDLAAAQDAFEAALSQAGTDPDRVSRQRSLAALYLGRIAFDRQEYDEARRWFHQVYRQNERLWNVAIEGTASLLLDSSRTNRQANALVVKGEFKQFVITEFKRFGPDAYILWYMLALTLVPLSPDLAREAFRHGAHGDFRVREKDWIALIALLWQLNPRTAGLLLTLVKSDCTWLDAS